MYIMSILCINVDSMYMENASEKIHEGGLLRAVRIHFYFMPSYF